MLINFISEFIIQFVLAIIISIILVNYFSLKYKIMILLFLIPTLTVVFLLLSNINFSSNKFDSELWKSNMQLREKMAKSVVKNKTFIGKKKEEIYVLLGKSFEKDSINTDTIFYIISEQYFPIYMYLKFKKNKVIEVGIITD